MKKKAKEFYLMHKDIMVCLMEIGEDGSLGSVRRNKEVKYGERVYLTRNGIGECAIIDMKELDELDKKLALCDLMTDLNRAKDRADKEGWIEADEAERILEVSD